MGKKRKRDPGQIPVMTMDELREAIRRRDVDMGRPWGFYPTDPTDPTDQTDQTTATLDEMPADQVARLRREYVLERIREVFDLRIVSASRAARETSPPLQRLRCQTRCEALAAELGGLHELLATLPDPDATSPPSPLSASGEGELAPVDEDAFKLRLLHLLHTDDDVIAAVVHGANDRANQVADR